MDNYLIHAMNEGLGGAGSPSLTHAFPDTLGANHEAGVMSIKRIMQQVSAVAYVKTHVQKGLCHQRTHCGPISQ